MPMFRDITAYDLFSLHQYLIVYLGFPTFLFIIGLNATVSDQR